jgi:phosphatidylglycerophosphate synthase
MATRLRPAANGESGWRYVETLADIRACETEFLRRSGKAQDGLVSRFVNRPISRAVTQRLLHRDMDPNKWTMTILILPVIAFFVMLRGDYFGFVTGLAIFQLYSILDGCDGEIARAKYLESEKGGRLDTWTDIFGGFIFIFGLGFGLYYKHFGENGWRYVLQAITCVLLIGINEYRLRVGKAEKTGAANELIPILYARHQALVHHSGILLLGEKLVWWLIQFTKRDVSIFVFFLLAVVARPEWILPLWMAVTAIVLVLGEIARWKRRLSPPPMVPGNDS